MYIPKNQNQNNMKMKIKITNLWIFIVISSILLSEFSLVVTTCTIFCDPTENYESTYEEEDSLMSSKLQTKPPPQLQQEQQQQQKSSTYQTQFQPQSRSGDGPLNEESTLPRFAEPIPNITVTIGRDALLACIVDNLRAYKVAWVRVDTQTILSIHHNVITQNNRISLSYNDHRSWYLHIREVEENDRGWYMCQVNTDPMRSRKGYLQVVVPPGIIETHTSSDMVVREGTNVTLTCKAKGYPEPYVMWRREDGNEMVIGGDSVNVVDGEILSITKVSRLHMAAYLCVASNGVPPSISKRVHLRVQFPPMLSIANQLEGAYVGQDVILECHTEAYPQSINYWTTERGDMIISDTSRAGEKYETLSTSNGYSKFMQLKIHNIGINDYGSYRCVAKNSLGETDGFIKLDEIPAPTTVLPTESTQSNRSKGRRTNHHKNHDMQMIGDFGMEEWKDDYNGDYLAPTRRSSIPSLKNAQDSRHNHLNHPNNKNHSTTSLIVSKLNTLLIIIFINFHYYIR